MSNITGKHVSERLESLVEQATLEARTAGNSLKGAREQLADNAKKKASQLAVMSRVHLDALLAGNSRLRPITQEVGSLISQRNAELAGLKSALAVDREGLEQEEVSLRTVRQTLTAREAQQEKDLQAHEGLAALRAQLADQESITQDKMSAATNIAEECRTKLKAYHEDPFFMHLHKIGYGTENSTGKWIFRKFDAWLASRISYRQAAQNFKFLNELPVKAEEAMNAAQSDQWDIAHQVEAITEQIAESSGVKQAMARMESATQRVDLREKSIRAHQNGIERIESNNDVHYKEILQVISQAMENMSLQTLQRLAEETDNREDERALANYRSLVETDTHLRREVSNMESRHQNATHRLSRAESLQRYCDDKGFDSSKRVYDSGFDLQALVMGYMLSEIDQSMLGRQLERQSQVIRDPEPRSSSSGYYVPSGSGSSPSPWGSSSSDNDTFKSRSSIGDSGGGFRSESSISDDNSDRYRSNDSF